MMVNSESERAASIAELVKTAIEYEPGARQSFLDANCRPELRAEVESLLEHQQFADDFIETPAVELAAEAITQWDAFAAGEIIGNCEIVSLIDKGGMGEVYLAQDRRLHRRVALKLVRRGMDSEEIIRRFHHEQKLLANLNHRNIAQLYDAAITDDGIPFFLMEYVDGIRIDDYCRERNLTIRQRLELFGKVCAAVHYAHQHLVVHRDIKPSNILVTADGEPKLLDFGIGKLLDAVTNTALEQTVTLQNVLTAEYASPEHVRGEPITTASDVYSLGVLLYELLTGSKPYRINTRTPVEVARIVSEQEPPRPSIAVASRGGNPKLLKGDLDNIVATAIRKEAQRRYSSVAQFAADIRRHLNGQPIAARKDTLLYRSSKFVSRHRVWAAAAALVVISLVAGLVGMAWQARVARVERDRAKAEERKAARINQFLQTMLSFSNQSITSVSPIAHKRDATVREMLERITPRVESELSDEPDVRAQVLRTIGSVYASQGHYEEAEKNLRAALIVQTQLYGENSAEAAATMTELGVLSFRQLRLAEANQLLEKAVAFYRRQIGTPQYDAIKLALALGDVKAQSDSKAAVALMNEAVETSSRANLKGADRAVLSMNKADLGALLIYFGQTDKGEPLLREAVNEFQQISNQHPWELGAFLTMLGVAATTKNNLDEAEKDLSEGEQIYRQTLGDRTAYLCYNLDKAAAVLFLKKELQPAEAKARESLAIARAISGENSVASASPLCTLSEILAAEGRIPEAEECCRQSLAIYEQQPTKNYSAIVPLKATISRVLLSQNRIAEAAQVATEAQADAQTNFGPDNPLTKSATDNLAAIRAR
ncbi:MAG: protein kinase domain-containing protein [Chthoniobacterales bacterium]